MAEIIGDGERGGMMTQRARYSLCLIGPSLANRSKKRFPDFSERIHCLTVGIGGEGGIRTLGTAQHRTSWKRAFVLLIPLENAAGP